MELLAPAGNMDCLKAAVNSGANAVYLAGKSFGARSFADNFSHEEIYEATRYCHLRDVKVYVTVNTMVLDKEFEELDAWIGVLAHAGVDGVIVQDMGVLSRVRALCPQMPIHASTQMTVHNLEGVLALEKLGVCRVVLSRELSGKDIRYIAAHCHAELEVFVHGAMCMSYSGQCLMSSVLGGRSGNRGKCAQPCRLSWGAPHRAERFYLSLKDMNLSSHLEALREMGVASLKIEGRMKGVDYVSTVVGTYRQCLDERRPPTREEESRMHQVFFRGGVTDGYFANTKGPKMFAFDKPDNPYAQQTEEKRIEKELPPKAVACRVCLKEGACAEISLTLGETKVTYREETPLERAQKMPISEEDAKRQLNKTGGTCFVFSPLEVHMEGEPFVPVKVLNQLRRKAIELLENALLLPYQKAIVKAEKPKMQGLPMPEMAWIAAVETMAQYESVSAFPFAYIEVPMHLLLENTALFEKEKHRIIVRPQVINHTEEKEIAKRQLALLREQGFLYLRAQTLDWFSEKESWQIFGGHRLNVANSHALNAYRALGAGAVCLSAELNLAQVRDMEKVLPTELLVYGHVPLMITENCVLKNTKQCPCDGPGVLSDRKGMTFPVLKDGKACRSVMVNSVPLFMADKLSDLLSCSVAYGTLLFTVENQETCMQICRQYMGMENPQTKQGAFTRMHFYKGVL